MRPLDTIRQALKASGRRVTRSGEGYSCRCPAHDDRKPSLSISEGLGGRALVYCHAGCSTEAVVQALGLKMSDLFESHDDSLRLSITQASVKPNPRRAPTVRAKSFLTPDAAAAFHSKRFGCEPAGSWEYVNAEGSVVGRVVRWDRPLAGKTYRPVSLIDGEWRCQGMPGPRPLYRLGDIATAQIVHVVEGEKCADIAWACGLIATTSAHGAQSPEQTDWSPVAGKDVVILPDHNEPGVAYAERVVELCEEAGAASVRIVNLSARWPGLPEGGDIADALEIEGGDAEATRRAIEELGNHAEPLYAAEAVDHQTVSAFQPFPVDVLPDPLCTLVSEAADAINCDASFIALPLLSGLAATIGNTHVVELKRGYQAPAILWTAIVGESGTAKSPALKTALKALHRIQRDAMREHESEMGKWEREHAQWEAAVGAWKRKGGARPDEPVRPVCARYVVSDTTVEALGPLLKENPRGLLLATDELAGWFGSFDKYSNSRGGDAPKWLSMHDGAPLIIDRKTSDALHVSRASVSVTGGIQPGALRRNLSGNHLENGLAARVLFAHPPRRPKVYTDAVVGEDLERAVAGVFERLIGLQSHLDADGEPEPRVLTLSPEAKEEWVCFVNANGAEQFQLEGAEASAYSKLESAAARLALVFQLVKAASVATVAVATVATEIDADSLRAGAMLARWFGNEALRTLRLVEESNDEKETRSLVEWISKRGGAVTVRDMRLGPRRYRKGGGGDPKRALADLVKRGLAIWKDDGRVCELRNTAGGDGYTGDTLEDRLAPSGAESHTDARKAG